MFHFDWESLAVPVDSKPKTTEERIKESLEDGMNCYRCGDWCPYAESNSPDGRFECWSCRENVWRPGTRKRKSSTYR